MDTTDLEHERLERGPDDEADEESPSPWAFVGILVGFKLWTLLLILIFVTSWSAVWVVIATHVLWISIAAIVLWAPTIFWMRLFRGRAKRRKLQRQEWEVEDTPATRR